MPFVLMYMNLSKVNRNNCMEKVCYTRFASMSTLYYYALNDLTTGLLINSITLLA